MCGRFTISKTEAELEKRFGASFYSRVLEARYNIAPTRNSPVLTSEQPARFQFFRWGLVPSWANDPGIGARMINARLESASSKPAFRAAWRRRRCLVIADGWYEWKLEGRNKQPYRILRRDREAFAMAGLWEVWNPGGSAAPKDPASEVYTFSIITRPALPSIAALHDRMPALLLPTQEKLWLEEGLPDADLQALALDYPDEALDSYPVSTAVNNARREEPSLLEPLAHPGSQSGSSTEPKPPPPAGRQGSLFD
jgi:putative SOS response-associated peptidase YedK